MRGCVCCRFDPRERWQTLTALAAAKGSTGESELALLMGDGVGERLTDSMGEKVFVDLSADGVKKRGALL